MSADEDVSEVVTGPSEAKERALDQLAEVVAKHFFATIVRKRSRLFAMGNGQTVPIVVSKPHRHSGEATGVEFNDPNEDPMLVETIEVSREALRECQEYRPMCPFLWGPSGF